MMDTLDLAMALFETSKNLDTVTLQSLTAMLIDLAAFKSREDPLVVVDRLREAVIFVNSEEGKMVI